MSKDIQNLRCELVSGDDVSNLSGKLKTIVDAIIPQTNYSTSSTGMMPKDQNEAVKDLINTILWDWFNFITDYKTDHLSEKRKWFEEHEKTILEA